MAIQLSKLVRKGKRLGRGHGKRGGKSGRGQKGQKSRAGYSRKAGFEGGQTPLYMRLPKGRGTKQRFRSRVKKPVAVSLGKLEQFAVGSIVGPGVLRSAGLLNSRSQTWKLIGNVGLSKKMTIRAHKVSAGAKMAVEKIGGKIELIQQGQSIQ